MRIILNIIIIEQCVEQLSYILKQSRGGGPTPWRQPRKHTNPRRPSPLSLPLGAVKPRAPTPAAPLVDPQRRSRQEFDDFRRVRSPDDAPLPPTELGNHWE